MLVPSEAGACAGGRSPSGSPIALDDSRLIDTWDRASRLARPWRELALLESASGIPVDELARLTIGERDRLLLALRIGTFGNRLECETRCPACETRLELSFDASELLTPAPSVAEQDFEIVEDDWTVRFRLPTSYDVAATADADELAARLISSLVIPRSASDEGPLSAQEVSTARPRDQFLPSVGMTVRERVAARMVELDPQADITLDLSCAACGNRWEAPFDPAAFLFSEVEAAVRRLTSEVHQLARAYAWSEESILAMGATRRRRYLDLVAQ